MLHYLRDAMIVRVVLVEGQFIMYPQSDQHSHRHTGSKSTNINERVSFISEQVPVSDLKIVLKHSIVNYVFRLQFSYREWANIMQHLKPVIQLRPEYRSVFLHVTVFLLQITQHLFGEVIPK